METFNKVAVGDVCEEYLKQLKEKWEVSCHISLGKMKNSQNKPVLCSSNRTMKLLPKDSETKIISV